MYKLNSDVANHLDTIASDKLNKGNYYGGRSVSRAATMIRDLNEPLTNYGPNYDDMYGIGSSINEMIHEYLKSLPEDFDPRLTVKGKVRYSTELLVASNFESLIPSTYRSVMCGSFRRGMSTVGDGDLITDSPLHLIVEYVQSICTDQYQILLGGDLKIRVKNLSTNIECDILFVEDWNTMVPTFLLHCTGPVSNNIRMRKAANSVGMTLNQYGLWDQDGNRVPVNCEYDVYSILGLEYKLPEDRI